MWLVDAGSMLEYVLDDIIDLLLICVNVVVTVNPRTKGDSERVDE